MKYVFAFAGIVVFAIAGYAVFSANDGDALRSEYISISSAELSTMMDGGDIVLVDVHTPEQRHIPGTDWFISYQDIDAIASVAEEGKPLVLYCRSGSMSKIAASDLVARGLEVYELRDGLKEWVAAGNATVEKGSVNNK